MPWFRRVARQCGEWYGEWACDATGQYVGPTIRNLGIRWSRGGILTAVMRCRVCYLELLVAAAVVKACDVGLSMDATLGDR